MVGQGSTIFTTPVICVKYDHVMTVGALDTALDMDYCQHCIDQECPLSTLF